MTSRPLLKTKTLGATGFFKSASSFYLFVKTMSSSDISHELISLVEEQLVQLISG